MILWFLTRSVVGAWHHFIEEEGFPIRCDLWATKLTEFCKLFKSVTLTLDE